MRVRHRNRLPKEAVELLFLEAFKRCVHVAPWAIV